MDRHFTTRLSAAAAIEALKAASRPETPWVDLGLAAGAVHHQADAALRLRFKGRHAHVLVHNGFVVRIEDRPRGATVHVTDRPALSRAWWFPGALAFLFVVVVGAAASQVAWYPALMVAMMVEAASLGFGLFAAAVLAASDARRLEEFLREVIGAREAG